jgi:hypothetical protein
MVIQLSESYGRDEPDYDYEEKRTRRRIGADDDQENLAIESLRFKNRRRFAYIAMFSILIVTALLLYHIPLEKIKALETIITWFYMTMGSVVGFYMGAATWSQVSTHSGKR